MLKGIISVWVLLLMSPLVWGSVSLDLTQAIDHNCDGVADSALSHQAMTALPGQCIVYRISAENKGSTVVSNIILRGNIPHHTQLQGIETIPTISDDYSVSRTFSSLQPGVENKLSLQYWVQILR